MTTNERTLGRAAAALYALVIVASMAAGDVVSYLPHVAILAVCCVVVPVMLRQRRVPREP